MKIKSGFSLNEIGNINSTKTNLPAQTVETNQTFQNNEIGSEEIKKAILAYAENKREQGARQIAITLTTSDIAYADKLITITINNETQREQLQGIKQDFLDELRKNLSNNQINLEINISKIEVQSKAYKPADIFKSMAEKNPALLELKKRFDLEIDY